MNKILITLITIAIALPLAAQKKDNGKKDDKGKKPTYTSGYVFKDFRGIEWGTHFDSCMRNEQKINFNRSTEVAEKNAWFIADDDMMIGTVQLSNIYYIFNQNNRFTGVKLRGNRAQFGEMKYILTYKFGDSELRDGPKGAVYFWNIDDVRIYLNKDDSTEIFTVDFNSDYDIIESKRINRTVQDF